MLLCVIADLSVVSRRANPINLTRTHTELAATGAPTAARALYRFNLLGNIVLVLEQTAALLVVEWRCFRSAQSINNRRSVIARWPTGSARCGCAHDRMALDSKLPVAVFVVVFSLWLGRCRTKQTSSAIKLVYLANIAARQQVFYGGCCEQPADRYRLICKSGRFGKKTNTQDTQVKSS